tara:strand:- start:56 stop:214 length:159 start_codon:yes stop_codon:yes gene_type:complete
MTKEEYAQQEVDNMFDNPRDIERFIYHYYYSRVEKMSDKEFKDYIDDLGWND